MSTIAERLRSITRRPDGKTDRGTLANLRRALSTTTRHYAWPVLASIGLEIVDEDAVLVAALYAEHPRHTDAKENLGNTWRQVYHKRKPGGGDQKDSYQTRFRRLISCDRNELPDQLVAVVRLADDGEGVAINYNLLYQDLRFWGDAAKLRWAKQFYAVKDDEGGQEGQ